MIMAQSTHGAIYCSDLQVKKKKIQDKIYPPPTYNMVV